MNTTIITFKELITQPDILKLRELVIDAENAVLGRLASIVVKLIKLGFNVYVVNIEKAVVTGDRNMVINSYKLLLRVKTHKNPYRHSMKRPRNPIAIFKRAVKSMLPKHNWLGVQLLKKVKAYVGIPVEYRTKKIVRILDCDALYLGRRKIITIADIAKELGWNPRVTNI